MVDSSTVLLILLAYVIGSIPSAVWIGKYFYKVDVREHGSGNAGATNTFRVLGKRAGFPVLIIDILKGFVAVNLAYFISDPVLSNYAFTENQIVLGIAALIGHIFPVLASFRGGKGVATLLGVILALHPGSALVAIIVFAICLVLFHYVSLSSILASSSLPLSQMIFFPSQNPSMVLFGFFVIILVLITHQKNIERLMNRKESKVSLAKKAVSQNSK